MHAIFTASINFNGAIPITAPQSCAAGYCLPYCGQLAKAAQQHIAPESSSYEAFYSAPTSDSPLINRAPVSVLPADLAFL